MPPEYLNWAVAEVQRSANPSNDLVRLARWWEQSRHTSEGNLERVPRHGRDRKYGQGEMASEPEVEHGQRRRVGARSLLPEKERRAGEACHLFRNAALENAIAGKQSCVTSSSRKKSWRASSSASSCGFDLVTDIGYMAVVGGRLAAFARKSGTRRVVRFIIELYERQAEIDAMAVFTHAAESEMWEVPAVKKAEM